MNDATSRNMVIKILLRRNLISQIYIMLKLRFSETITYLRITICLKILHPIDIPTQSFESFCQAEDSRKLYIRLNLLKRR